MALKLLLALTQCAKASGVDVASVWNGTAMCCVSLALHYSIEQGKKKEGGEIQVTGTWSNEGDAPHPWRG